jgi:hypothetical protein
MESMAQFLAQVPIVRHLSHPHTAFALNFSVAWFPWANFSASPFSDMPT